MNRHQPDVPKGNLLLVDDTPNNLRSLSVALGENGYKVRRAINGSMALVGATANPPDLILLDLNMPDMSGYEFCQKLKKDERTRNIPVIFLSEIDEVRERVQALSLGGADYITKPFQVEEVLARVETHLTLRQLYVQMAEQNAYMQRLSVQLAEQNVRLQQEMSNRRVAEQAQRDGDEQLQNVLQQLQQAQAQLLQREKLSSLGNLATSIAYEINSPVNLIYGNLQYAINHTQKLLNLFQLYQKALPAPPSEIQNFLDRFDFGVLQSDLPQLMNSMKVKTEQISEILQSWQDFSRLDDLEVQSVDLHESLNSAVTMLQESLRPAQPDGSSIRVFKEYGNLPLVECHGGQMSQVFLQVLANAIEALQLRDRSEASQFPMPMITICTECRDTQLVKITITDNGVGMTEEVSEQIFKPFFTTKEKEAGSGLGMAISYAIVVHQHQGQMRCFSNPGKGTSIEIELPVKRSRQSSKAESFANPS